MAMFFAGLQSEEKLIATVLRQKAGVRQTTTWRSMDNRAASIRSFTQSSENPSFLAIASMEAARICA
jgi:hypothetical protein